MSGKNETEFTPELMTVLMKEAADARDLPNTYINLERRRYGHIEYLTWLSFETGQKSFYYTYGVLLEKGAGKWGRIGRNINHKAELLVANKYACKIFLEELGVNVPKGKFFRRRNIEEAIGYFDYLSKPICVKPNNGFGGGLVFPSITDKGWYEHALRRVAENKPNILVEESVTGEHFRFFLYIPRSRCRQAGNSGLRHR